MKRSITVMNSLNKIDNNINLFSFFYKADNKPILYNKKDNNSSDKFNISKKYDIMTKNIPK